MALESLLQSVGISCSTDNVLAKALLYFAFTISSYHVGKLIFSYVRVLLSLLVLPGISVS